MPRMTQAEYLAYELKRQPPSKSSDGCDDEGELHQQIIDYCRQRNWLVFHGSMAHKTFRTPGEPDLIILRDGGRTLMIECKTKSGKLSVDQIGVKLWAEKLGHQIHVVRSAIEFMKIL